jgi:hypothetical protein
VLLKCDLEGRQLQIGFEITLKYLLATVHYLGVLELGMGKHCLVSMYSFLGCTELLWLGSDQMLHSIISV